MKIKITASLLTFFACLLNDTANANAGTTFPIIIEACQANINKHQLTLKNNGNEASISAIAHRYNYSNNQPSAFSASISLDDCQQKLGKQLDPIINQRVLVGVVGNVCSYLNQFNKHSVNQTQKIQAIVSQSMIPLILQTLYLRISCSCEVTIAINNQSATDYAANAVKHMLPKLLQAEIQTTKTATNYFSIPFLGCFIALISFLAWYFRVNENLPAFYNPLLTRPIAYIEPNMDPTAGKGG